MSFVLVSCQLMSCEMDVIGVTSEALKTIGCRWIDAVFTILHEVDVVTANQFSVET